MKKVISLCFLVYIFGVAHAQIDSLKIKTSVSLQARDWLYLNSYLANNPDFENVYDSIKVKLRATVIPSFTTVIKVDSVRQDQIILLAKVLKAGGYGLVVIPYSRINAALRSNAYLIIKIDAMDADYTNSYNFRLQSELDKLRAVLNLPAP